MDNLFSMDNRFFRAVGKLVDLIWINLLTLVCALPVVTAGASFASMYYLLLRMAENDSGALTRGFFTAFRRNFKNATAVWLIGVVVLALYGYELWLLHQGVMDAYGVLYKVTLGLISLILLAAVMVLNYYFALLARYDQDRKQTLKNAALLTVGFLPRSLAMAVLMLFPLALMLLSDYFFWLWFLYGFSYPGYLIARLMLTVFQKTEARHEGQGQDGQG